MGIINEFNKNKISDKALPFFPAPFPDEAIVSQVVRYHIMRAHRTEQATYDELFQVAPFSLTYWVPHNLDRLARKLPGDSDKNLAAFIQECTLMPLFQTFGRVTADEKKQSMVMPRRIVGETGTTHLCLSCLVEDMDTYGSPYIHRAHQIPGVTACWKHGTRTIVRCPSCKCPFEIPKGLVLSAWKACACGRVIDSFSSTEERATPIEIDFARFAKDLLFAAEVIDPVLLVKVYKKRILELGFRKGKKQIARARLLVAIEESYDREQLHRMDFAYRKGRLSGWLNILCETSVQEAPLGRHLLFAHYLFREAKLFLNSVRFVQGETLDSLSLGNSKLPGKATNVANSLNDKMLGKDDLLEMLTEFALRNGYGLEELWTYQRVAMKKLVKLDPDATQGILAQLSNDLPRKIKKSSSQTRTTLYDRQADEDWAKAIQAASVSLYASAEKPVRVTMNRLLKESIVKSSAWPNSSKFPLAYSTLEQCRESQWHFYARCIVWMLYKYPEYAGRGSKLVKMAKLESHKGVAAYRYFSRIDCGRGLSPHSIISTLQEMGIPKDWRGPNPDQIFYITGRGYARRKRLQNA